jgi:hypothetical protein
LHALAADAGVERYRMLPRGELIAKLSAGGGGAQKRESDRGPRSTRQRPPRRRSSRGGRQGGGPRPDASRPPRDAGSGSAERKPKEPGAPPPARPEAAPAESSGPKRKRRRRRWGRRRKGVRVHDLLLPAAPGRQAIVYGESREGCTALLREVAAELSGASNGPDPIALLVDPSPEELADWKREAPQAEIVAAGQARHANDAFAQAVRRADSGESVIVLVDSLSRFVEAYGGADAAKELFDAGRQLSQGGSGSLTVVAAVEKSQ